MASRGSSFLFPFLQDIPLFRRLPPDVAGRLFRTGKTHIIRAGRAIVTEGKGGGDLHILVSGRVEVIKKGPGGKFKSLATLGCGELFGEMSAFDGGRYSATIRAIGDCAVHIIRGKDFHAFLKKNPAASYEILTTLVQMLSSRLRSMNVAVSKKD